MIAIGYSSIGKAHIRNGLPNQDAILVREYSNGSVLTVADGVGSDKNSEYASQAAVSAIHEVFDGITEMEIDVLPEKICDQFDSLMSKSPEVNAGTTCVFCAHLESYGLILGQIGDGICCGHIDGYPFVLRDKEAEFANIVEPLSVHCDPKKWFIVQMQGVEKADLMIATDGIADDIMPGKEAAFAEYMIGMIKELPEEQREGRIKEILEKWETPNSNDDKTIAFYSFP